MRVELLLNQGLEHYGSGRLREAVEVWQTALKEDPENLRAREYLRNALHEYGPLRDRREEVTGPQSRIVTAWDEGPSLAIPVHIDAEHTPMPVPVLPPPREDTLPPEERSQLGSLIAGARELYALNDFSGALELLDKVLALEPGHMEARRIREDCVETLIQMYESELGPLSRVPRLAMNPDEIIWLNLDHRAGFVLSQIDGTLSFDDLYAICGMPRLDTARILAQLVSEKVLKAN